MKNLFLTCCMALSFAYASAQTTPAKTKKTDTTYNKKGKYNTENNSGNKKVDTIKNRQRTENKKRKSTTKTETTPQRRDTVNGTTTP